MSQTGAPWWQRWRKQTRTDQRLEDPSSRRLAEAVLSRADPISARDQVQRDMLGMMRHFRVDPRRVAARFFGALRAAEETCARCPAVDRCQHWFHGPASDDAPRSFCPNAELYGTIAASQRPARPTGEPPAV